MPKKPAPQPKPAVKPTLTLRQQFDKWFLPTVFVAILCSFVWALWRG